MATCTTEFDAQYATLTAGVGLVDFSNRTQIELSGSDCAKFLHNLCTNAIRELRPGSGCEAFLLNVKGHVVGHVFVFVGEQSIVLETVPGQGERLMTHIDRYIIREDVQLHDRSMEWAELLLSGMQAETLLAEHSLPIPKQKLEHTSATIADQEVWVRRVDMAGPIGFLIAVRREAIKSVLDFLVQSGAVRCSDQVFETCRIERGTPLFAKDITEDNLPQEVGRDSQAISFTKGCYLGQETVARIDALGHVNRLLKGLKLDSTELPSVGTELTSNDKVVGSVTSSCWSPQLNSPLALAYVRRGHHEPGVKLKWGASNAEVINLPLSKPLIS